MIVDSGHTDDDSDDYDNVDCNNHQDENSDDVEVWNSGMASAMDGDGSRWDAGYRITSIIFGVIIIVVVIMIVAIILGHHPTGMQQKNYYLGDHGHSSTF